MPKFDFVNVDHWFEQIEDIFQSNNIDTEFRKFAYAQAMLDRQSSTMAREVIFNANDIENPYTRLKTLLTKKSALSKQRRVREAMEGGTFMDNQSASSWLQEKLNLLKFCTMKDIKKYLLLKALPVQIQSLLEGPDDVKVIALRADEFFDGNGALL